MAKREQWTVWEGTTPPPTPYDCGPSENAEVVAWVRDHGGLDAVKSEWSSRIPYDKHEQRRQRLLGHIAECETALGRRNERIKELDLRVSDLTRENAELRKRAMPEGCEWLVEAWPRFEDGEPVRIGDEVCGGGRAFIVDHVVLFSNDESTVCAEADMDSGKVRDYVRVRPSYRLKRPAPKVLDADGVEIRVGDTVYHVGMSTFDPEYDTLTVTDIRTKPGLTPIETKNSHDGYLYGKPEGFTHRSPVLAADGKPLRERETVWSVDSGTRYTVEKITDELIPIKCRSEMGTTVSLHPSQLTHERPVADTWGRIEDDCTLPERDYYARHIGHDVGLKDDAEIHEAVSRDIVRRCLALAERERGE